MVMKRIMGSISQKLGLRSADLQEAQTAHMMSLQHEHAAHPSVGLTPSRLAEILREAETGDIVRQYELFEDMEEKDAHLTAELGKRRRAILGLDWTIAPPKNATAKERDAAAALNTMMQALDDFEDVLFDITDAIGKGFSMLEFDGWGTVDGDRVPNAITYRPQSWFQLHRAKTQEIRLRGAAGGIPLQEFTWIEHRHKAKSGYLERAALFRVLVWPYLFKNFSVGDLSEFLEIYGIPMRVGKYPTGATKKEKLTLLRALAQLGHNAAGIIPQGMDLEFLNAASGDGKAFEMMITWCEKSQSKAILGGTLTSQADGKTSTNALGNVHNDVRMDLRDSDAVQIAKTLSRCLIYPMAVVNGLTDSWQRCPRFVFDVQEPEDLTQYGQALPQLVSLGFKIPREWAQRKLAIPEPEDNEDILQSAAPAAPAAPASPDPAPAPPVAKATAQQAGGGSQLLPPDQMLSRTRDNLQPATDAWIQQIRDLLDQVSSLQELRDRLLELYPSMTLDQYATALAEADSAANLAGRNAISEEH